jgi:hypothetical protein
LSIGKVVRVEKREHLLLLAQRSFLIFAARLFYGG